MATKVIDLTHDSLPEHHWQPIRKRFDKVPAASIIEDRVLLREWEQEQVNHYYRNIYDRRDIDIDVFKRFQLNGEIIKMTIDAAELTKDKKFWQLENEIQNKAVKYVNSLRKLKPFDLHNLQPQTYDLKMPGDVTGRQRKKPTQKESQNKKTAATNKQKKKIKEKLGSAGSLLGQISEDEKEDKNSDGGSDGELDHKYDPLSRQKQGGPKLDKKSMLQSAVEQTALELGKAMPVMSRGPELELSTISEVEDLKHTLAQAMIHIPNDVLRRAIVMPKDIDSSEHLYPTPRDSLPRNPKNDAEHHRKEKERKKLFQDLIKWQ